MLEKFVNINNIVVVNTYRMNYINLSPIYFTLS